MRRRSDCQAQQRDLKTIATLSHRPIVLTDTTGYQTIGFLHYRPNPSHRAYTDIDRTVIQHNKSAAGSAELAEAARYCSNAAQQS